MTLPDPTGHDHPFDLDDRRERIATPLDLALAAWCREAMGDDDPMWMCPVCDLIVESHFHCPRCGCEPPWGCDCGQHEGDGDDFDPLDVP